MEHVRYLAADELAGRAVGTVGIDKARDYIGQKFKEYGLTPGGDGGSYFQQLMVTTGVRVKDPTGLMLDDRARLRHPADWVALGVSGSGTVEGEVVFAGYGITAKDYGYDDYAGVDAQGKIVLVLRYEPPPKNEKSPFRKFPAYSRYATLGLKAENARSHGAVGMILVDLNSHGSDDLISSVPSQTRTAKGFIAVQVRRQIITSWLSDYGVSLQAAQERIDREERPAALNLSGRRASMQISFENIVVKTQNVVGLIPGSDPQRAGESVVIGAHYDHIGTGYVGIRSASQEGKIHNGADDNASGIAVLLGLARALSEAPEKPACTVVFAAFTAEELGLHGSRHYVQHPVLPLRETRAMINLDMVGRMRNRRLSVYGVETAREFRTWVEEALRHAGLDMDGDRRMSDELSDHFPFYEENVSYLTFFTGLHEDYHQPTDDWEKLNFDGMQAVQNVVLRILLRIAAEKNPPTFVRSRPPRYSR